MDGSGESSDQIRSTESAERARGAAHRPAVALAGGYGHPLHIYPAAVAIGTFVAALAFDIASRMGEGRAFGRPATWLVAIGVLSGVVAAVLGLIDFLRLTKGTRARQVATWHLILMDLVLLAFVVSFILRRNDDLQYLDGTPTGALVLSVVGVVLLVVGMWFGSTLVSSFGVRVADEDDQLAGYRPAASQGATSADEGSAQDSDSDVVVD